MHCIKIWIIYNGGKFLKFYSLINDCCLIQLMDHLSHGTENIVLFCQQKEEDSQSKDERKYVENRDKNMGNQVR